MPFVESVTCLLSIETTSVSAESLSPVVTRYVLGFPAVVCMTALGGVFAERGRSVPIRRYGSIGRGGVHPSGRNKLLSMMVR